jgi:2-acylglycerol O-acyltransferase 2
MKDAAARVADKRPGGCRDKSLIDWVIAAAAHCVLIPMWTMSPLPMLLGLMLLLTSKWAIGLSLLAIFALLNVITFRYVPAVASFFEGARMQNYYDKCELRGTVGAMRREKTLFCFHPHGVLAVGFVVNGCWSTDFHQRTSSPGKRKGEPPVNTCFLIAPALREFSGFFKVMCEMSGRLESAKKSIFQKLMRQGRNLAIIPGGFEDSTIFQRGAERTYLNERKGLIK